MGQSDDLLVVGAYPGGADYDIRRGNPAEHAAALRAIAAVPMPAGAILSPAAKVPGPGSGAAGHAGARRKV